MVRWTHSQSEAWDLQRPSDTPIASVIQQYTATVINHSTYKHSKGYVVPLSAATTWDDWYMLIAASHIRRNSESARIHMQCVRLFATNRAMFDELPTWSYTLDLGYNHLRFYVKRTRPTT